MTEDVAMQLPVDRKEQAVTDPIVEEVHKVRAAIARRFNNGLHAICQDAGKRQEASGRQALALPPRRVGPTKATNKKVG